MVTIKLTDSYADALLKSLTWLAPVISSARTYDNELIQSPEVDSNVFELLDVCDNEKLCVIRYVRDLLFRELGK